MAWKRQCLRALRNRNDGEGKAFAAIFGSYLSLLSKNDALKKDLEDAKKEVYRAEEVGEDGNKKANKKLERENREMEAKLRKIEGENATLKNEALELHKRLYKKSEAEKEKSDGTLKMHQEYDLTKTEYMKLKEQYDLLLESHIAMTKELKKSLGVNEVLQGELTKKNELLAKAEHQVEALNQSNQDLVQRLIDEKKRIAEEMNQMNVIIEQMRAHPIADVESKGDQGRSSSTVKTDMTSWRHLVGVAAPKKPRLKLNAHGSAINHVIYDATGKSVLSAGSDSTVKIWNASDGASKATLHFGSTTAAVMCLDVYNELVVGSSNDKVFNLWNVDSGRVKHSFQGHSGKVNAVKFVQGAQKVLTGGSDRTLKLWDLSKYQCLSTANCASSCNSVSVTSDCTTAFSGHQDGAVRVWDVQNPSKPTKELKSLHSHQVTSVYASNDGTKLLTLSRDNTLVLLDTRTYAPIHTIRHQTYRAGFNWARAVLSPDSNFAMAGSGDGILHIWSLLGEVSLESTLTGHVSGVAGCAWSPEGRGVVTGDTTGNLIFWE